VCKRNKKTALNGRGITLVGRFIFDLAGWLTSQCIWRTKWSGGFYGDVPSAPQWFFPLPPHRIRSGLLVSPLAVTLSLRSLAAYAGCHAAAGPEVNSALDAAFGVSDYIVLRVETAGPAVYAIGWHITLSRPYRFQLEH
jgi:hypothetical protein